MNLRSPWSEHGRWPKKRLDISDVVKSELDAHVGTKVHKEAADADRCIEVVVELQN